MSIKKIVSSVCCALVLTLGACSRQQSDWQKSRETNTTESYEQFLKKYPSGEFTAQAQARVKELYEERDWQKARDLDTPEAYQGFLKQYPEGKWTEEARIRVENFTLAQAPSGTPAVAPPATDLSANAAASPSSDQGTSADPTTSPRSSPAPSPDVTPPPKAVAKPAPSKMAASKPAASRTTASRSAAAVKTPARVASASGSYAVQLGAFRSGADAAHQRWAQLQKNYPTVLAGLSSKVLSKKSATGSLYRLHAVGLTEKRARSVCASLIAKAQACIVVSPTSG